MAHFSKLLFFCIAFLPSLAYSQQVIETWECKEMRDRVWNVVVLAQVLRQGNAGYIRVAGITHSALFRVKGFTRRWDFGASRDGTFDYAFVIEPSGKASYYEFEGVYPGQRVEPTHKLHCVPITTYR